MKDVIWSKFTNNARNLHDQHYSPLTAAQHEGTVCGGISPEIGVATAVEGRFVLVFHTTVLLVGRLSILRTVYTVFLTFLAIHYGLC